MGIACKNTKATDTSILFEIRHSRNAHNIVKHSKASNMLTHTAVAAISGVPPLVFVCPVPYPFALYFSRFHPTISTSSLSQQPAQPCFHVQIPLSAHHAAQRPSQNWLLAACECSGAARLRSAEKKNCDIHTLVSNITHAF